MPSVRCWYPVRGASAPCAVPGAWCTSLGPSAAACTGVQCAAPGAVVVAAAGARCPVPVPGAAAGDAERPPRPPPRPPRPGAAPAPAAAISANPRRGPAVPIGSRRSRTAPGAAAMVRPARTWDRPDPGCPAPPRTVARARSRSPGPLPQPAALREGDGARGRSGPGPPVPQRSAGGTRAAGQHLPGPGGRSPGGGEGATGPHRGIREGSARERHLRVPRPALLPRLSVRGQREPLWCGSVSNIRSQLLAGPRAGALVALPARPGPRPGRSHARSRLCTHRQGPEPPLAFPARGSLFCISRSASLLRGGGRSPGAARQSHVSAGISRRVQGGGEDRGLRPWLAWHRLVAAGTSGLGGERRGRAAPAAPWEPARHIPPELDAAKAERRAAGGACRNGAPSRQAPDCGCGMHTSASETSRGGTAVTAGDPGQLGSLAPARGVSWGWRCSRRTHRGRTGALPPVPHPSVAKAVPSWPGGAA